jgi:plastocyanin
MDMNVSLIRRAGAIAAVAAACSGLAACGSGNSDSASSAPKKTATAAPASAGGGGQKLTIAAKESGGLSFTKSSLKAKAGTVTITMDNPGSDSLPHAIAVEGHGVDKDGSFAQPGDKSTVSADLKPGKYEFYCPVGNHRQQGMEGTLTVE